MEDKRLYIYRERERERDGYKGVVRKALKN